MTPEKVEGERAQVESGSLHSRTARLYRAGAVGALALTAVGTIAWYAAHVRASVPATPAARGPSRPATTGEMALPPIKVPSRTTATTEQVASADGAGTTGDTPAAQGRAAPHVAPPVGTDTPPAIHPDRGVTSPAPVLFRVATATSSPAADAPPTATWPSELAATIADIATPPAAARRDPRPNKDVSATLLPDRRFLLGRGSFLDCTLETAIDSTLPGLATCVLAADVYGSDGRVVLMERGTRLIGETHADVRSGQTRVAVVWSEARTPAGVRLDLESQATDALGRAGVPGQVDRHLGERFGAAVLLSFIDAAATSIATRQQAPGALVYNPQASRDIATEALRGSIAIPPTIRVSPGAQLQVVVATDVDFRGVYRLVAHEAG